MNRKSLEFVCGRFCRLTGQGGVATVRTSTRKDVILMNAFGLNRNGNCFSCNDDSLRPCFRQPALSRE